MSRSKSKQIVKEPKKSVFIRALEALNAKKGEAWGFKCENHRESTEKIGNGREHVVAIFVDVWMDEKKEVRRGMGTAIAPIYGNALRWAFEAAFARAAGLWGLINYEEVVEEEPADPIFQPAITNWSRPNDEAKEMAKEDGRPPNLPLSSDITQDQIAKIKKLAVASGKDPNGWLARSHTKAEGDAMIRQLSALAGPIFEGGI